MAATLTVAPPAVSFPAPRPRPHLRSMAKVDTFSALSTLYADTSIAGQTPGNGAAKTPFQIALSVLKAWLYANWSGLLAPASIASGSVGSQAIAANTLVTHIIITSTGAGTVNIGTSSGGTQISAAEPYVNGTICFVANEAFTSSATLYFSGHSHTLTVKIITVSIA